MSAIKNVFTLMILAIAVGFVSCGDDAACDGKQCMDNQLLDAATCNCVDIIVAPCDGKVCTGGDILDAATCECVDPNGGTPTIETLAGEIKEDKTLTSDRIYLLAGKTYVTSGATLTIMPGTIIKGAEGTGSLASALIIARGSKIEACGTTSQPIVFTSELDNIVIGERFGTNLGKEDRELWGGLIVLGSAPISAADGDTETQIEGIPGDVVYGKFGGNNPTDNSGTLCYISIRHGGALIGADNEINGLTLGGVGSGTSINNIEVVANLDDGIEFFGGTVNVKNALIAYQGDDAIDIDMNYSGTIDNVYIIHGGDDTDEAFEIDGPENVTYTEGKFTIKNVTAIAEDANKTSAADLKSKAQGSISNASFEGYNASNGLAYRASFNVDNCSDKSDSYTNMVVGNLTVSGSEMISSGISLKDFARVYIDSKNEVAIELQACLDATDYQDVLDANIVSNGNKISSLPTVGATRSNFSWTWAAKNGLVK